MLSVFANESERHLGSVLGNSEDTEFRLILVVQSSDFIGMLLKPNLKFLGVHYAVARITKIADQLTVGTCVPTPPRLRQGKRCLRRQDFHGATRIERE